MVRRRFFAMLVVTMVAVTPGAAHADPEPRQVFLGAPFDDATAVAGCFDSLGLTGTCVTFEASADAETGSFALELLERTREQGSSVGVVTGTAGASFVASSARTTPTQAVLGAATLDLDEVVGEVSGTLPLLGSIDATVHLFLEHDSCATCTGAGETLLDLDAATPSEVSVLAVMADPSGAPVPPGVIRATVHVILTATLAGIGEVHGVVTGALRQIELATPSVERVLGAPYTAARADRSCGGSPGTTFTCRSAVARSSGRLEMDLDVISPVAGSAPGSGSAIGGASIALEDEPSGPVRARVYVVDYAVDSAEAFVQGATPVLGSSASGVEAAVRVTGPCDVCASSTGAGIVDAHGGPVSLLDEVVTMSVWSREASDVPATEQLQLTLDVFGSSILQNSAGIATGMLRSRLASVRVYEIA